MNEIFSYRPLLAILVSAIAGILILATPSKPNLRETWSFIAAVLKFSIILSMLPAVYNGSVYVLDFPSIFPGVRTLLRVDALGLYFALLSSALWIITTLYNVGYMRTCNEKEQTRYYFSFALSLSAAIGIAFAGDLAAFFIFFELLTFATYPLVAHKETKEAILAGRKYLVYSLSAASLLFFAIVWTYHLTGDLSFRAGGMNFPTMDFKSALVLFFLFVYGVAVKAALFPMHAWLPSAMVAPTPVSALLHAVAVVKAGVFGILRVTGFVFGPQWMRDTGLFIVLLSLSGFTILFASAIALVQDNLKRRLAYSTISQLSYIILGASLLSSSGYLGSVLHMANHALLKITLFFCAGAYYAKLHVESIHELRGAGYKMPWTTAAFTLAALGLSGFPPLCGFISKWFLCKGALEADSWIALMIYLLSGLLSAAYLLPVSVIAFRKTDEPNVQANESPWTLTWPPVMTALLAILFCIIPFLFNSQIKLASIAVNQIFGAGV